MDVVDTIYISLGNDCCIAYQLQILGLRKDAYPFDWLNINDISNIGKCLQKDFSNFIDEEYLIVKKVNNNFSYIDDDWTHNENKYDMVNVVHKLYNFNFKHDFKIDFGKINNIQEIKIKYDRRIKRFYDVMKSPNKKILLIKDKQKKEKKIKHLIEIMNEKGFINYIIKFISHEELCNTENKFVSCANKWQRNDFNWQKWILDE